LKHRVLEFVQADVKMALLLFEFVPLLVVQTNILIDAGKGG